MKFPASKKTMSPGTNSYEGMETRFPSRMICASGAASFFNAASASSARRSWTIPSTAFNTTIAMIAAAST